MSPPSSPPLLQPSLSRVLSSPPAHVSSCSRNSTGRRGQEEESEESPLYGRWSCSSAAGRVRAGRVWCRGDTKSRGAAGRRAAAAGIVGQAQEGNCGATACRFGANRGAHCQEEFGSGDTTVRVGGGGLVGIFSGDGSPQVKSGVRAPGAEPAATAGQRERGGQHGEDSR